jgi:hypothetical protein
MNLINYFKTSDSNSYSDNTVLFKQVVSFDNHNIANEETEIDHFETTNNFDQNDGKPFSYKSRSTASFIVHEKVTSMIFEQLYFPMEWEEEKISKPNLVSKQTALIVCKSLFDTYCLMPDKISPTKEEGVFMRFDYSSGKTKKSLIIEVYNTLEIAAIVTNNDTKEVVFNIDIEKLQFNNAIKFLKKIK